MKKMQILAAFALAFCGSMTSSYADDNAASMAAPEVMSSEEKAFAAQLSTTNSVMFSEMAPSVRAEVMKMAATSGGTMTADQAMEKMCSSTNAVDAE